MSIKTDLNIAPYFDDYDISKKYYRVLFKPGFAVQARELTQIQSTLQNQIEQFGENIYKEGSIIKGCTFSELRNLQYVKVVDGIRPEDYVERTEVNTDTNVTDEYYYELEDDTGLKALILQAQSGFQSRAPDLNTFFILYLNTGIDGSTEKKKYSANDTIQIREFIIRSQTVNNVVVETTMNQGIVNTTSVAGFSDPIGDSFGLSAAEGIIFQRGHFLFVDGQTIVLKKYMSETADEFTIEPNAISAGYIVDENIVSSQQDASLLDNSLGSPNENAPGADRLVLVPRLVSRPTPAAEADPGFFILRRYENGFAVETRSATQFNSIATELARRTYEAHGDFVKKKFDFIARKNAQNGNFVLEMGEGSAYSKGFRITNDTKRFFDVPAVTTVESITSQPINFSYGGYCKVLAATGRITIGSLQNVALLNAADATIGTAIVKNYEAGKIYLFGIRMSGSNNFSNVTYVKEGSALGKIEIDPKIVDSSNSKLLFSSNRAFVNSFSDVTFSVRRSKIVPSSSGDITIEPAAGEVFNTDSLRNILVIITSTNATATISTATITAGNLVLDTDAPTEDVTVYYNVNLPNQDSRVKQVFDIYVKTTYANAQRFYTLGIPDAIEILEVKDSSGVEYMNSFKINRNQKDDFYDHSYIEKIPGSLSPADSAVLTVKVKVFRVDSSVEMNFFTPDSYVNIDHTYIQKHETQSGQVIDLNSSIDFRPYRIPLATYSATAGNATTMAAGIGFTNDSTQLFDSNLTFAIPSADTSGIVDIDYYGDRTDYIVGSSNGRFRYISGDEIASNSVSIDNSDTTTIAEIYVPGFPLLAPEEANKLNRKSETIQIQTRSVKAYTMKDIDSISKRVDRLVYYTTLTALETATQNLLILDANGLNRFKNGIIVDPFNDLMIADLSDPTFNAAIDTTEKSLTPSVSQFPLALRSKAFSGTQTYIDGKVVSLASSQLVRFIRQQYASGFRTCTSNFYSYVGSGQLTPSYDVAYDTVTTPVNIDLDFATPLADFADALSDFIPLTTSATSRTGFVQNAINNGTSITTTSISTFQDIRRSLEVEAGQTEEQFVGNFLTNVQLKPFMRTRDVSVEVYGLRPSTRHYFFFDNVPVNDSVAPAALRSDLTGLSAENMTIPIGAPGTAVTTNANGELFAVFTIPETTFLVGERELMVADVSDLGSIESASASLGKFKYNAYNFAMENSGLTVSTRVPEIAVNTTTTNRTVTNRTVVAIPPPQEIRATLTGMGDGPGGDPLAQTFFIKDQMAQGADALYVGRLDLYFKRKGLTNGVTVMLREVINGYPSNQILSFSKKHLRSTDVNVSDDSSVATVVIFDAPVRMEPEKEYCLVVMPDAADPDYLIFTQKVGGTDLISGGAMNSDWGEGVLFTSTNDRAWKSYQDEDVKFDLYRYNYGTETGTVELETKDVEFFTVESVIGRFTNNETVYAFTEASSVTYPVVLNTTTNVVTGTGLTNYDVGDTLYVENGSGVKDILRVVTVTSATQIIVNKPPLFAGSFNSRPIVSGSVSYFNQRRADVLILENSSARADRIFENDFIVRGLSSNTSATIVSIDNKQLSYIQNMINTVTDSDTSIGIAVRSVDPLFPDNTPYVENFSISDKKSFSNRGCVVFSKSNDVTGVKNLKFILTLKNNDSVTNTPIIDVETAQIFAYIYNVTNDSATTSKYISKKVELREGFDAEDFRLFITGYRPKNTNIKVFVKLKNEADPISLRNNPWIELEIIEGVDLLSSDSNESDFKEFVYSIPSANKASDIATYTNETGVYTRFRSFAIRIDLLSTTISRAPRVKDYRGVAFE